MYVKVVDVILDNRLYTDDASTTLVSIFLAFLFDLNVGFSRERQRKL